MMTCDSLTIMGSNHFFGEVGGLDSEVEKGGTHHVIPFFDACENY